MSVAILNGPTVLDFVEDREAFNRCIIEQFAVFDTNGDGVLSRWELKKGLEGLVTVTADSGCATEEVSSLHDLIFSRFDSDRNGTIDVEEFRSEMREILLAVAHGLGDSPVQVVLESDCLLMKAVEHELANPARERPEVIDACSGAYCVIVRKRTDVV